MANTQNMIPEWQPLDYQMPSANDIFRHFMFIGETGSGKTESGIKPVCRLALDVNQGENAAALVIDPKGDLSPFVHRHLAEQGRSEQLVNLAGLQGKAKIWLFEGREDDNYNADAIAHQILAYSEVFRDSKKSNNNNDMWISWARQLLTALIQIDWHLFNHVNGAEQANIDKFWAEFDDYLQQMNKEHKSTKSLSGNIATYERVSSIQEGYTHRLHKVITRSQYGVSPKVAKIGHLNSWHGDNVYNAYWYHFTQFANSYAIGGTYALPQSPVELFMQFISMSPETYSSVISVFDNLIRDLMDPQINDLICLDPFTPPNPQFSIVEAIATGKIAVFQPGDESLASDTIGRMIKGQYFHAALHRSRLNNPATRPFFYICDEFQRYISDDKHSGEQSFLDRCRAFRVCCVLATQSVASLRYELPDRRGDQAIKIIMSNTGHKFFFRSTDPDTARLLRDLMSAPAKPHLPHLIAVRPPTTLAVGECYFLLPDGRSGRSQIRLQSDDVAAA